MDKDTLLAYQPDYYKNSDVMTQIDNTNAIELTSLNSQIEDLKNQMFIDTATTALTRMEKEYEIDTILTDSFAIRRSRILAKKRGQGIFTVSFVKNLAESFENGKVDVVRDDPNYTFTIKFVSTIGIPSNIDDLKSSIEELKPAHLAVNYEFTYMKWSDASKLTWGDVSNYTWEEVLTQQLEANVTTLYSKLSDGSYAKINFEITE